MFRHPWAVLALCCMTAAAQDHVGQYTQADIDRGSRLYGVNCVFCHGPSGDAIANVDLRSGKFRKAGTDEDLGRVIVAGVPGTAMPPHKLQDAEVTGIVAYIRSMRNLGAAPLSSGDARRGKEIFAGKAACASCHRVNGQGSRLAPDLSDIGMIRSASALQTKLVTPTANMLPMNRSVRAVTKGGQAIQGRRLNEDTYSVQLIDAQERLVSLAKADLKEYEILKTSAMPSYQDKLTAQERADVLAYLLTLKGVI
jgi:putative heme-binding domain-containing protein